MVIINAKIYPMDAPTIESGWLRFEGGKITGLGAMAGYAPADGEEVLDAAGKASSPALSTPTATWGCGRTPSVLKGRTATK